MSIEVLVSTMNVHTKEQFDNQIKKMNISGKSLTINQCPNFSGDLISVKNGKHRLLTYIEKGLSKSRNKAITNSQCDICVIADDDLIYYDNYESIIKKAYDKYKDADIIAFYVNSLNKDRQTTNQKEGKISFLRSMKISSFQITFKRESILNDSILFDEFFGAGSGLFTCGEENIFLYDCLKKGKKIYYVPISIADVYHNESTWFNGFDEKLFVTKGACFYRMSNLFSTILNLQFIVRKYNKYKKNLSVLSAWKFMKKGRKLYREVGEINEK